MRRAWPWWLLSAVAVVWLLWMTLRPNQTVAVVLLPLTESVTARGFSAHLLIDVAGNVVVFVPLGFGLMLALRKGSCARRLFVATVLGAALSLLIESVQMAFPTRVTALDDWLLNTAGAAVGALAGCPLAAGASRRRR